jgi:hypothetical protein
MLKDYNEVLEAIRKTDWLKTAPKEELQEAQKHLLNVYSGNHAIMIQVQMAHDLIIQEIRLRFK